MDTVLVFGVLLVVMVLLFVFLQRGNAKRCQNWKVKAEGTFDHVGYNRHNTAVFFEDGRTWVLPYMTYNMRYPKGTNIKIKQNSNGTYAVEKA